MPSTSSAASSAPRPDSIGEAMSAPLEGDDDRSPVVPQNGGGAAGGVAGSSAVSGMTPYFIGLKRRLEEKKAQKVRCGFAPIASLRCALSFQRRKTSASTETLTVSPFVRVLPRLSLNTPRQVMTRSMTRNAEKAAMADDVGHVWYNIGPVGTTAPANMFRVNMFEDALDECALSFLQD